MENSLPQNRRANDQSLDNTPLPANDSDHVGNCSLKAADNLSQAGCSGDRLMTELKSIAKAQHHDVELMR